MFDLKWLLYSNCVNCVYLWEWKVVCLVMAFNYFALKASLSSSWATCPFPGGKFLMHTCIIMKAWTCTKRCHHLYILQTYRNIIQESEWGAQITRCLMLTWTVTNALTSSPQQKPIICAIINEVQTEIILYFIDIAIYNIKPLSKHLPR